MIRENGYDKTIQLLTSQISRYGNERTTLSFNFLVNIYRPIVHNSSALQTAFVKLAVGEIKIGRGFPSRFVLRNFAADLPVFLRLAIGANLPGNSTFDFVEYAEGNGNLANLKAIRFARSNSSQVGRK